MMAQEIIAGNKKMIDAGSVILPTPDSSMVLKVEVGPGFVILVELCFLANNSIGPSINTETNKEDNYIKFICYNFNNSLGTGTNSALNIAVYNNKKVTMHLWSYLLGESTNGYSRKVEYTFYIDK